MNRVDAIRNSMLWAAYGDALGFMTELADALLVRRRLGHQLADRLRPWKRRIGGKFGAFVELPAGCYSDDTQLRLASSRAISGDGHFDVEAFAKIECAAWRSFALGAGRGTKAAANNLVRPGVQWCNNFYNLRGQSYFMSGGNGAAMRIQPHVWVTPSRRSSADVLRDVVRNAVTTHGHMRGIVGAAFHALSLYFALVTGKMSGPREWLQLADKASAVIEVIRLDSDLSTIWLPAWEDASKRPLDEAVYEVIVEIQEDVRAIQSIKLEPDCIDYESAARAIGALHPDVRGSATKTSLLANVVAWGFQKDLHRGIVAAANLLNSDTDTVASMAGALGGTICTSLPPDMVMDQEYLTVEAERLARICEGRSATTFPYPDLLSWAPAATEIDWVVKKGDRLCIRGLGEADPLGPTIATHIKPTMHFRWLRLWFGQTVLVKQRPSVSNIHDSQLPFEPRAETADVSEANRDRRQMKDEMREWAHLSIQQAVDAAFNSSLQPELVGELLLKLCASEGGLDKATAFAGIVAREIQQRLRQRGVV